MKGTGSVTDTDAARDMPDFPSAFRSARQDAGLLLPLAKNVAVAFGLIA